MIPITISDHFFAVYPEAHVGILAIENLQNPKGYAGFEKEKYEIIRNLKDQFPDRQRMKAHPVIEAYSAYYKQFGKTYHLIGQVESAVKNKSSASGKHPVVEAMFLAELKNLLLTAGHDLDHLEGGLDITAADGTETYTSINGREIQAKKGDMLIRDEKAPISTVIYGPDLRTRITRATNNVVYTVYVPKGIPGETTLNHLNNIGSLISKIYPSAETTHKGIYP